MKKFRIIKDNFFENGLKVGDIVTLVEGTNDLYELPKQLHGKGHKAEHSALHIKLKENNYLYISPYHLEEIEGDRKMNKNELKSGMIVEFRNGDKRLVIDDNLIGDDGFDHLSNYNDDLKNILNINLDIIKVYKFISPRPFNALLRNGNLDLIWERKDNGLSDKEIDILNALKTLGYKFLARDESLYLYAYSDKPYKSVDCWLLNDGEYVSVSNVFNIIEWEDKEPTNIDDLLKGI